MTRFHGLAALVAQMAMATLATGAQAQSTFSQSQLNRPAGTFIGAINETINKPVGPVARNIADAWGSATTFALADYGTLKSKASASGTADGLGVFFARAAVGFSDQLMISSPGLNGQAGTFNAIIVFDRVLSVSGSMVDGYSTATLNVGTSFDTVSFQEVLSLQPSGCLPTAPGCALLLSSTIGGTATVAAQWQSPTLLALSMPITFSQTFNLSVSLDMSALAKYYQGQSTWLSDASQSLYWGGITSVSSPSAGAVPFQLTSASQTDYLHSFAPVPEPGTAMMFLAGLLCLMFLLRPVDAKSRNVCPEPA